MFAYNQDDDVEKLVRTLPDIGPQLTKIATDARNAARKVYPLTRNANRRRSVLAYRSRLVNYNGTETQAAFLASWDRLAVIFEFGSINSPPYRPLSAGIESAGLDIVESDGSPTITAAGGGS